MGRRAQNKRGMGGVIFIDLRDREGMLQVVFDAQNLSREDFAAAEGLRVESVVAVRGELRPRSEETRNPRLATGAFELCARGMEVLSEARPLPCSRRSSAPCSAEWQKNGARSTSGTGPADILLRGFQTPFRSPCRGAP
ncbi:OB-fold nucleic acid binding domain-containing protein [Anaerotruncus sp. DFI.9.16]|uniref:OB-fold nucleic acid binding domain-containing protein n=1 Tax=Anaerotruncus sp. DFI.9.16 TaxID=2965275 RepID=UPI00210D4C94|nr:OB-fold nucleic acid binding domain-containing protein [Anaerotruncus sp. DFI.9.16]MCQ4897469.1 OB-fold nucleic acid binding domain-containing protein [Anaerotruncus sp. DFI.9.16]